MKKPRNINQKIPLFAGFFNGINILNKYKSLLKTSENRYTEQRITLHSKI